MVEGKIEMARELKKKGIDIHIIADASGLSKEEIEKL
jgi:predicted transposase/invertase (TIGR01784 family)